MTTMVRTRWGLSQETTLPSRSSTCIAGAQALGTIFSAFTMPLAGNWLGSRVIGTWASTHIGCQPCRWWHYPLCHNIIPRVFRFIWNLDTEIDITDSICWPTLTPDCLKFTKTRADPGALNIICVSHMTVGNHTLAFTCSLPGYKLVGSGIGSRASIWTWDVSILIAAPNAYASEISFTCPAHLRSWQEVHQNHCLAWCWALLHTAAVQLFISNMFQRNASSWLKKKKMPLGPGFFFFF